jgi:EamA domain-containing membrane protein RarD
MTATHIASGLFLVVATTAEIIRQLQIVQVNRAKAVPRISFWHKGSWRIYSLHRRTFPQSKLSLCGRSLDAMAFVLFAISFFVYFGVRHSPIVVQQPTSETSSR